MLPTTDRELNDDGASIDIQEDSEHVKPRADGCIQRRFIKEVLCMPLIPKDLANPLEPFCIGLRSAYLQDYKMDNVITFGKYSLQWCERTSFTNP
jgi:hypothetical protein